MLRRLRPRLSFANVTSVLALFVALGGTSAYAVNEWTGANIVDQSLTGADVKGKAATATAAAANGSLTGADIAGQAANPAVAQPFVQGSLTGADVQDSSVTGADVATGSIKGADIGDSSLTNLDLLDDIITGSKVVDGGLKDEDVGQGSFVDFVANIPAIPAHSCRSADITGVDVDGDHILLTPPTPTRSPGTTTPPTTRTSAQRS